ncbi:MAG: cupredoxin domain-containing protein, partial [Candidatus Latescibacterota bacterium]
MTSILKHITMRTLFIGLSLLAVMIALNCGIVNNRRPKPDEVWIENGAFRPIDRNITPGTRVTWVNRDSLTHTVTSGVNNFDGNFDSGEIPPGGTYQRTFYSNGVYPYF